MSSLIESASAASVKVARSSKSTWAGAGGGLIVIVILALAPMLFGKGFLDNTVSLFSLIVLATMWNLMAGYGGMVSIGQQAYIGIGAYGLVYIADTLGVNPLFAMPIAAVVAGLISFPISFLAFRLSGGYFAIGTWVIAEVIRLITMQLPGLGGGSGMTLRSISKIFSPEERLRYAYWLALGAAIAAVAVTYLLMRSRLGLGFTAMRDDSTAAGSLGVNVVRSRRIVFIVSATGCALAGALTAVDTLGIKPLSIFSVEWSAMMIFAVVIGGLGTIEGPIIGAVIYFGLQQWLTNVDIPIPFLQDKLQGTGYLIILGALAVVTALFLPRGIWGLISRNGKFRLFPVGYTVVDNPVKELAKSLSFDRPGKSKG